MAKKFIDADVFAKQIYKRVNNSAIRSWLFAIINEMPAADVQEVRHWKWESTELMYQNGCTRCSECKTEYYVSSLEEICGGMLPTFCPTCGARMDGEEND